MADAALGWRAAGAPTGAVRQWSAALGAAVILLTVATQVGTAPVDLGARVTGATAGATIGVLWAFWRWGHMPLVLHLLVVLLIGTMSAAFAAPLALVPAAMLAALLIGWDVRPQLMAAALGGGLSAALLAGTLAAIAPAAPAGLLPALVVPPLVALGSSILHQRLSSMSSQRDLARLLSEASSRMVAIERPEQLYGEVLRTAQRLFEGHPSQVATVVLLDRDLHRVVASRDHGDAPPVGRRVEDVPPPLRAAYDDPGVVILQDADAAAVFRQLGVAGSLGSALLAPMTKGDDDLGMLVVEVDRPPPEEVLLALDALADMAGIAIAEAECADELAICDARFRSLVEDSADVIAVLGPSGTMRYLSPSMREVFGHSPQALTGHPLWHLLHPDDAALLPDYLARAATHDRGSDSICLRLRDHAGGWRWAEVRARRLHAGCGATCSLHADVGVEVVANLRDVTEREKLRQELEHRTLHDQLTGLPNRTLLNDRVAQALATAERVGTPIAMLYLDLDDFKAVNDSLGHTAGDALLIEFADRLRGCVRPSDTTARLGGDEFAILLPVIEGGEDSAREVAQRIRDCLHEPFQVEDLAVRMRISIGLALSEPQDEADDLLRRADVAMYLAKDQGGDRIRTHHPDAHDVSTARLRRIAELQRAVERHELITHFQPIIDLTADGVLGFEALARWAHPGRGLVSPGEFIPLAETVGLIREMDLATLRAACQHLRRWQLITDGVGGMPLTMNVNLSGTTVMQPRVIGDIAMVLEETGVDPRHIVLELTEGVLLDGADGAIHQLSAVKQLGVRLAVDDFGIGYSSLAYLQAFPVDVLKIDKSFTDTVDGAARDGAVTRSIVDLARELGLSLIAEGIERSSQVDALRRLACPQGQGFHLARPMAPTQVEAVLHDGPRLAADAPPG